MTKSTAADQGHPQPAEVRLGSGRGHLRASARSRQLASEVVPGEPFAGIPLPDPTTAGPWALSNTCPVAPRRGHPDRLPEGAGTSAGTLPSRRRNVGDRCRRAPGASPP